jgi:hypothetical protein
MPNFTAGTSFGANDTVTNTKLNALIADATINPECSLSINSGTIGTLSCTRGTIGTFNSTTGTVATLNTTTGSVQTLSAGTLATNLTGGTYSGLINSSTGTYSGLINSSTGTFTGSLGGSANLTSGTIQTLTASTLSGALTGGTYSGLINSSTGTYSGVLNSTTGTYSGLINSTTGTFSGSLGTSCNFTAGTINRLTSSSNATISGITFGTGSNSGSINTAVGAGGVLGGTGAFNSAYGYSSLASNTSGEGNSAYGYRSLFSNTTGRSCVAVGNNALEGNTTSSFNTAIGNSTLYLNSTGTGANTAIGYQSMYIAVGNNNSSALGASSTVTGSNQVQLGDSATTTYAYGAVQNRSDIRDKADVRDTTLGLEFVNELRPVDFKWDMREYYRPEFNKDSSPDIYKLSNITHDGSKKRNRYHHGLIAQEVKEVLDKNGIDFGGFQDHKISGGDDVLSIGYGELIAPMIKAIQQLSAKVDSLEAQLASK